MSPSDFIFLADSVLAGDFDLMLVGDGSGTTASRECGWGCVCYDRRTGFIGEHHGGCSAGSNNFAELAPYVQVLTSYFNANGPGELRVLVVSDSELTVRCGEGLYSRRANLPLWAQIDWFAKEGYRIAWRHVKRNSNPLSARADALAGWARKRM